MVEIKFEIDDITFRAAQKRNEVWSKDCLQTYIGTKWAILADIWTGWSGLLTTMVLYHPTWKWPLWVREQTRPESPGYIPVGFSWGAGCTWNQRYHSFTMVGLRDRVDEPIVGLDGAVMPRKNAHSLTFWLLDQGKLLAVGEEGEIKQALIKGYLPVVETIWKLDDVEIKIHTFADSVDGVDVCFVRAAASNSSSSKRELSLFAVVTPWGPDQFHPISELKYDAANNIFVVNGYTGVLLDENPDGYTCMNYDAGDVCVDAFDGKLSSVTQSSCDVGYCTGAAVFNLTLAPGEERSVVVKIPIPALNLTLAELDKVRRASFERHLERTTSDWEQFLERGMKLEIPDKLASDTYKSALINLHLLKDGSVITAGPTLYHGEWIRDAAHIIRALDITGFHESSRECLDELLHAQNSEGYFWYGTTDLVAADVEQREYDSNGQAIWALIEHYKTTGDKAWLAKIYPFIKRGAEFIIKIRYLTRKKEDESSLHYGLLPKSCSAEHTGPTNYIYYDDFWGLCGLKEVIYAASELGLDEDVKQFVKEYQDFESCVWNSVERVTTERKLECFPASPYQDVSGTIIGNIACFWPCKLVDPWDIRLEAVLNTLYSKHMPNGCWFNRHIWGAYGPILTWSIANCFLHRLEIDKLVRIFKWTLQHGQSSTHAWPEGVNAQTMYGSEGDAYVGWAMAEYVMLLKNMLVLEQEDSIWITPCIPKEWLNDGSVIKALDVPTTYGKLDLTLESSVHKDVVIISLNLEREGPSKGFTIFINHPLSKEIRSVSVDGKEWNKFSANRVEVPSTARDVKIGF